MRFCIIACTLFVCWNSSAQKFRNGKGFDSVFASIKEGTLGGTSNGVLFCEMDNEELILDFQGSNAVLRATPDPEEVYDTNTKTYAGKTTSGKTEVEYSTYAWANELTIKLGDEEYQITAIDGGCDMVINGIDYYYQAEERTEYLVLIFTSSVELDNWQRLIRDTDENRDISELKKRKKTLKVKTNSSLTFAIRR